MNVHVSRERARSLAVLAALLLVPTSASAGKDDFAGGTVVFARDHSLWRTDPKGKETPTELVALPDGGRAADVHMIRSDATGAVILFDLAGAWYWLRTDTPATIKPLPCAADARVTGDGKSVVCADADGNAVVYSFRTGRKARRAVPAAGARVIPGATGRDLVWADADGVWAAPLNAPADKRELAPDAPLRGFSSAPDGTRALGVYLTTAWDKRTSVEAEGLMTFLLDGKAARRKSIRHGVVIDWSWDSTWLLVQDGESACIARAVGGEYKCWKGYAAASLSPDGRYALLIGKRKKDDDKKDDEPEEAEAGEGGESDEEEPTTEEAPGVPERPWSVYRARLEGAYTEKPSLIETVIDGAGALWLPGKPAE